MPSQVVKTYYTVIAGYEGKRPEVHYIEADDADEAGERICNSLEMLGDPIVYAVFEDIYEFKFRKTSAEVYAARGIRA